MMVTGNALAKHRRENWGVAEEGFAKVLREGGREGARHTQGENNDQGDSAAVRPRQRRACEPRPQPKREEKRYPRPHGCQPTYLATLLPAEEFASFCARQKHQQQESQPVNKIQNPCLMGGKVGKSPAPQP